MSASDELLYALELCVTELLHDGVPTNPKHPRRVALDVAENAFTQSRQVGVSDDEFNEGDRVVWTNMFGTEFTGTVTARDFSYSLDLDDGAQVKEATRVRAAAPAPARSAS